MIKVNLLKKFHLNLIIISKIHLKCFVNFKKQNINKLVNGPISKNIF